MAPVMPFLRPVNREGLILPVHQNVPGQRRFVPVARIVEAPVLGDAHYGVGVPLVPFIALVRSLGGHLQHEVGRLALLGDEVAVAGAGGGGVGVQGDEHIGKQDVVVAPGGPQARRRLAEDYRGVQVAQVVSQGRRVGREIHVMVGGHIQVTGPGVRKPDEFR